LEEIVNRAYEIFGSYKLTKELDVCTQCCVTIEEKKRLETEVLREIPYKLIYLHNTAASSIKPPIEEFKYFLPRYLELISKNEFPSHSIELSLKRFEHYQIEEFNDKELEFIEEFCQEYFKQTLALYPIPEGETIDSILVMLNKAQCNIIQILNYWKLDRSQSGNKHFTDLVNFGLSKRHNKLSNPFSSNKLNETVENWLGDGELFTTKYNK